MLPNFTGAIVIAFFNFTVGIYVCCLITYWLLELGTTKEKSTIRLPVGKVLPAFSEFKSAAAKMQEDQAELQVVPVEAVSVGDAKVSLKRRMIRRQLLRIGATHALLDEISYLSLLYSRMHWQGLWWKRLLMIFVAIVGSLFSVKRPPVYEYFFTHGLSWTCFLKSKLINDAVLNALLLHLDDTVYTDDIFLRARNWNHYISGKGAFTLKIEEGGEEKPEEEEEDGENESSSCQPTTSPIPTSRSASFSE